MNKLLLVLILDFVLTVLAVSTRTAGLTSVAGSLPDSSVKLTSLKK